MSQFRFIHAADLHLDSPLRGLAKYEGAPQERLRAAPRQAFSQLVDLALAEAVDFMVIAGDVFDGDWKDIGTGLFFAREMARLQQADIPVFLLHGNHDAQTRISRQTTLPENVRVFASRGPQTFRLDGLQVALHGQSFAEPATMENLVLNYPEPVAGAFNIGVLHTALEGGTVHANYAPCSLEQLRSRGYDYWALGHVHEYRILNESPPVVYPGNLQGRMVRETGAKGAVMVTVEHGVPRCERLIVDVLRWHQLEVDVSAVVDLDQAMARLRAVVEASVPRDERLHALRIRLTGRTEVHPLLLASAQRLREQALMVLAGMLRDDIWVEKVLAQTAPDFDLNEIMGKQDALGEFARLFAELPQDEVFLGMMEKEFQHLIGLCPGELDELCAELAALRDQQLPGLIADMTPTLLAGLRGETA